jgi:energy-coupling factor transport system permease protein
VRPRDLHPGAWWLWAVGLALLASRTTNPLLLALIIAVCAWVAVTCRRPSPWSRTFAVFVKIGLATIVLRVLIQAVAGHPTGDHVLFTLPEVTLPDFFAGTRLGGEVTGEALAGAGLDGMRLLAMLCCFGVANVATTPSRLVKAMPAALYEAGLVVTVAVSLAPQAVASLKRVAAARRLRGRPSRGVAALRGIALPVLEGAMEQSLALAAAMDSRGYGRRTRLTTPRRLVAAGSTVLGIVGTGTGVYGLLAGPRAMGVVVAPLGIALLAVGLLVGGSRSPRTRYRPDRWAGLEWTMAAMGTACTVVAVRGARDPLLVPTDPLTVPTLPAAAAVVVVIALLPSLLSPGPRR